MQKLFIRTVVLLLMPCLTTDPARAGLFISPLSPAWERGKGVAVNSARFSEQALIQVATTPTTPMTAEPRTTMLREGEERLFASVQDTDLPPSAAPKFIPFDFSWQLKNDGTELFHPSGNRFVMGQQARGPLGAGKIVALSMDAAMGPRVVIETKSSAKKYYVGSIFNQLIPEKTRPTLRASAAFTGDLIDVIPRVADVIPQILTGDPNIADSEQRIKKLLEDNAEEYWRKIVKILASRAVDIETARDMAQNTMLKASRNAGQLREANKIEAWLGRIAANEYFMFLRQLHAHREEVLASEDDHVLLTSLWAGSVQSPDQNLKLEDIHKAISRLPPFYRDIIGLIASGMKPEQLAEELGITGPAAKSRLLRARIELAKKLGYVRKKRPLRRKKALDTVA